jgi:hypothetical protein
MKKTQIQTVDVGAVREPPSQEIYITDDPAVIDELHARGVKEIAVRDGREYVFKKSEIENADAAVQPPPKEEKENAENR